MAKTNKPTYKHSTVMLIDDNEIDNFINHKMIEATHFAERVYVHTGGKSALEFYANLVSANGLSEEFFPKIIFLDINMPIMDGFQFLDEFQKLDTKKSNSTKVIMLTTSTNPLDEERARGYKNVIKFLHKPLLEDKLNEL